jgi:FtsZ-binding cell division protein ZapB
MVTLEQVRQLETKIVKAIEYVNRVSGESSLLRDENNLLRGKLDDSLKRVEELEDLVQRFKEDQGRIEEGIIAALDRLNQFEDAIGKSLTSVQALVSSPPSVGTPADTDKPVPIEEPSVPVGEGEFDVPPQDTGETEAGELDIF